MVLLPWAKGNSEFCSLFVVSLCPLRNWPEALGDIPSERVNYSYFHERKFSFLLQIKKI